MNHNKDKNTLIIGYNNTHWLIFVWINTQIECIEEFYFITFL